MLERSVDRVYSPRMVTRLEGVQAADREFWRLRKSLSRALARTLWPGQNPWGQMITTDGGTAGRRLSRRPSARPFQDFLPTDSSDEPGLKRSIRTGSHGNLSG